MSVPTPSAQASASIKEWVAAYSDGLYSLALYKTSDKECAEDLVQETFLAAYQHFDKFENKSSPKTWLHSILKNKVADHFRKAMKNNVSYQGSLTYYFDDTEHWNDEQAPHEWLADDEGNLLDNADFQQALAACLGKLPESWRISLIQKFVDGKDGKLICQELGVTPSNYWQMLHRAKLQVRKCMELNWFGK